MTNSIYGFFMVLFGKRMKVFFHLKSGKTVTVVCRGINIKINGSQEITSYSMQDVLDIALYIRLDDISSITHT